MHSILQDGSLIIIKLLPNQVPIFYCIQSRRPNSAITKTRNGTRSQVIPAAMAAVNTVPLDLQHSQSSKARFLKSPHETTAHNYRPPYTELQRIPTGPRTQNYSAYPQAPVHRTTEHTHSPVHRTTAHTHRPPYTEHTLHSRHTYLQRHLRNVWQTKQKLKYLGNRTTKFKFHTPYNFQIRRSALP
jgi:hypothetical protein